MLIYFLFILYSVCRRHLEHLDADSETDADNYHLYHFIHSIRITLFYRMLSLYR